MIKKKKAIVLGAGPVGLVTSWLLAEKNWDVKLFEMKDIVGGMCRTWKWKDFYVDTGPHIFHTDNKNLWKFWKKIFGNSLIEGKYFAKNAIGNDSINYIDYPISKSSFSNFSYKQKNNIIDISENKEDFVYPVQFVDYKYELSKIKQHVSKYNQIFSLGTGGDFNYADSQILFHKSMDLVNILTSKNSRITNEKKEIMINNLNNTVMLGKKIVGNSYPVYVIAEAGLNHNGSLEIAKKLIDQAVECGCDAIKFQSFEKNSRVSSLVKSANYAEKADGLQEDMNQMFNRLRLDKNFHKELFKYAKFKK